MHCSLLVDDSLVRSGGCCYIHASSDLVMYSSAYLCTHPHACVVPCERHEQNLHAHMNHRMFCGYRVCHVYCTCFANLSPWTCLPIETEQALFPSPIRGFPVDELHFLCNSHNSGRWSACERRRSKLSGSANG